MSSENHSLREVVSSLRQDALSTGHRRLLVCSGQASWCRDQALTLLTDIGEAPTVYIGGGFEPDQLPEVAVLRARNAREWLGREIKTLVFDGHSGFDVDAFGAISGSLSAGGILLLLTPELSLWPDFADPEHRRMMVYPQTPEQVTGRYLRRLATLVQKSDRLSLLTESGANRLQAPALSRNESLQPDESLQPEAGSCRTACQSTAVTAIHKVVRGHRKRPLVLTADRGRGKSAALGIAAAQLLLEGLGHITVTAPSRKTAEVIFAHARESLGNQAEALLGCIHFLAPDELAGSAPATDLLMVDEAAAIPTPLLETILKRHSRIVFATTVHGYEGNGRGFAIRFRKTLDARTPQWRELRMEEPIRWRSGDPVEAFVFQALLLNAAPCDGQKLVGITPEKCHFQPLSRTKLLSDEALLNELFGLLVLAHYQTRPFDLRHLLDGGNIEIYGLFFRNRLVGTVLAAREGDIEDGLREGILLGQRRVKGHLLPQSLSHHLGIRDSVALQGLRIIRIAVHPQCQGMGLGKKLMTSIRSQSLSGGIDYLGTLFGATEALLAFWHQVGMVPVRIGVTREAASGVHSVMMLQGLSAQGAALTEEAVIRFQGQFHWLLMDCLRELDARLVSALIRYAGCALDYQLSVHGRTDLLSFTQGLRPYEGCIGPIKCIVFNGVSEGLIKEDELPLLVNRVLQNRDWQQVARSCALAGQKQARTRLREIVARLVKKVGVGNNSGDDGQNRV